jgi:hypothetical protein
MLLHGKLLPLDLLCSWYMTIPRLKRHAGVSFGPYVTRLVSFMKAPRTWMVFRGAS